MKRVAVPIHLRLDLEDAVMKILLTMGPETVGYEGRITEQDPALIGTPLEKPPIEGLIFEVPEEMPLRWVEQMVRHALRDAGIADLQPGSAIALE